MCVHHQPGRGAPEETDAMMRLTRRIAPQNTMTALFPAPLQRGGRYEPEIHFFRF